MGTELYIIVAILLLVLAETTVLVLRNSSWALPGKKQRKVFVDTSSLIDGRVLAVARTGFIGDELVVPRSVLAELQLLADGSDSEKRTRARFGLDVVADLQKVSGLKVTVWRDEPFVQEGVDNRLIALAKKHSGLIMTNDFNLNKVAIVEGIEVLNINELAQNLRSEYLPGDKLGLDLVQKGSESGQAVGYLADGTMVVVGDAASDIGQTVEIEFVRYLQTAAGKMMFAKKIGNSNQPARSTSTKPEQRQTKRPRRDTNRDSNRTSKTEKPDKPDKNRSGQKNSPSRRKRETGEDRLVRLANKQ
jgi:uncharacterized protein YacL